MKKVALIVIGILSITTSLMAQDAAPAKEAQVSAEAKSEVAAPVKKEFYVYKDKMNINNHYIPSGWMGDYGDLKIDDGCTVTPYNAKHCFKVTYTAQSTQGAGWAGIFWQNPANNWGNQMGGYDLTGYKKLTFWVRGDKGGEIITEFKVGGINGTYPDSDSTSIGPITLTTEWKQYEIPLDGLDLSYISGGFCFVASARDNSQGVIMYLDDVKYEQ